MVASVGAKCLQNVKILNYTSTTVTLDWDYTCSDHEVLLYRIDYNHKSYKACSDGRRDFDKPTGFGTAEVDSHPVKIKNLNPYSEYSFEVRVILQKGRPESDTIVGTTDYSIPKARAQPSTTDYSFRNTDSKLVFNWSPPLKSSECELFNAPLGKFVYIVQGIDPWNKDFCRDDILPMTKTLVEVDKLEAFSSYIFLLYIANEANEYDENVYLKLEGQTLPTTPDPPIQLRAHSSDAGALHISWVPASPRKGAKPGELFPWSRIY